ncbi:MAG: insulinase family protein [Lachnospiraceae bacterium]|nr:insulinase family protein [Lachnospiraceae bacterium]
MTKNEQLEKLKQLEGYTILESRDIPDLDSLGVIARHDRTGARITLLINDDDNKVFCIGFRTPPTDSTGVAHILEHSVLCGSDKYPVKDPFIELAKGSLNTFLNAMTFPDKTIYPVASCNEKDFENLTDVYLDAVFHPNIYREEKIFRQEGWHYELEEPDGELKINGVVYNEMKGAFSSPDDVVSREIMEGLFPDTPYGVESGGHPDNIPDLTYEDFLDFHSRYYHPSNSYIYLYGDCDMSERLAYIDSAYLSHYEKLDIDSSIRLQPAFESVSHVEKEYPIAETASEEEHTYLTYSMVVSDDNLNPEEYIAFEVLDYALCSTPGAPVKKALIDAGIGKDVYSDYTNSICQPYFSFIAKDTDMDRLDEFTSIIEDTLKAQINGGLDHESLMAALNLFEFKYREADYGSYPKGLMLGMQMLDSWLYDDMKPFVHVISNDVYASLKAKVDTGYYEELIRDRILNNNHKVILAVRPVKGLTTAKDKQLADKLEAYRKSLSDEERERMVAATAELAEYQESEDSPEALATIPMLKREDMRRNANAFIWERRDVDGIPCVYHNIQTNGIGYIRFLFNTEYIKTEDWVYLGLLKSVMGLMDTSEHTYSELFKEISLKTGGIVPATNLYSNTEDIGQYKIMYEIKGKTLYDRMPDAIRLMTEMMLSTRYDDKNRLHELIDEVMSHMHSSMISAGHSLAVASAASQYSEADATMNTMNGIPYLRVLESLNADYDGRFEYVAEKLKTLCVSVFRPENLTLDYTGSEESFETFKELVSDLASKLYTDPIDKQGGKVAPVAGSKAYTSASQVQYVARGGDYSKAGLKYNGALRALKVMMGYDYLWTQVRVRGGAYGCMTAYGSTGKGYFVSYRDPNLRRTVGVFEGAADYVRNFDADERTMTQYIIGAIADLDIPMTPSAKGAFGLSAYMTNLTMERLQRERDELLATTPETIRSLADYIDAIMNTGAYCVVGGEEAIQECAGDFDSIEPLFNE